MNSPCFYESSDPIFADAVDLYKKNLVLMHDEYVQSELNYTNLGHPWYEFDLYEGKWDIIPLYMSGNPHKHNVTKHFRNTYAFLLQLEKTMGEILVAGFSTLGPGTTILPHDGIEDGGEHTYRMHFSIEIPRGCYIKVEDEYRTWKNGEVLIFNDAKQHTVCNLSKCYRTVLLVDVAKDTIPDGVRNDMITHYRNIGYLPVN